jgi:UrcA family protein
MIDSSSRTARSSSLLAGAVAIAIFAGGAQARSDVPQVTVRYKDSADTSQLYSQLQSASAVVCRQHQGKELRKMAETRACYNQALNNAVAKIGNVALSSLHHDNTEMRLAQRGTNRQRT